MVYLEDNQKIAFARIVSDLIEADFIIDEGEMKYFEEVVTSKSNLNISTEMLRRSRQINLEDATNQIKKMREKDRNKLLNLLEKTSLSDGTCVPSEALLILAIRLAIENKAYILSVPSQGNHIEALKCIYIENEYNEQINEYICEHLRTISNEFQLAGIEFIYIPQIVNNYKELKADYLQSVISFMIPSYSESRVKQIQEKLCSLTTVQFCKELLHEKMGFYLKDLSPSLLLKIGDSYIVNDSNNDDEERNIISNYLCIPIEPQFIIQTRYILDIYKQMVSKVNYIEVAPIIKKFKYSGFYKSLFNLIAFAPKLKTNCYLLIDLYRNENPIKKKEESDKSHKRKQNQSIKFIQVGKQFEDINVYDGFEQEKVAQLGSAIYTMILLETLRGKGCCWSVDEILNGVFNDKFNNIYSHFSGREYMPDFNGESKNDKNKLMKMRDHQISVIKSSFNKLSKSFDNISKFELLSVKIEDERFYRIKDVCLDDVFVRSRDGKIKNIKDSVLWKSLSMKK